MLLLIYCYIYIPMFLGVLCLSLFYYALLGDHSSFASILKRKRKLDALLLLSYRCIVTVNVLWLFLTVPWVGLQCVIVVILTYFLNVSRRDFHQMSPVLSLMFDSAAE